MFFLNVETVYNSSIILDYKPFIGIFENHVCVREVLVDKGQALCQPKWSSYITT